MDQGVMPIRFRYGLGSNPWPLHIAHFCCRSRGRIFVSYRGNAGFVEFRGYWEFAAQNRSSGWNTWLAFSIAPAAKAPMVVK